MTSVWQATMGLRVVRQEIWESDSRRRFIYVPQQMWVSSDGKTEWRDLPVIDNDGRVADYI